MTEPSREESRTAQINQIYQALGQFVVEFSRMVRAMESGLIDAVGGNQQAVWAITSALTGQPLVDAWRSVMTKAEDLTKEDQRVLSSLQAEATNLITLRNDWMHGAWFVGYGNETTTDWSKAAIFRLKNTKVGVAVPKSLNTSPESDYIKSVAEHVSVVADAVFSFGSIVSGRRHFRMTMHPSDRVRITKVNNNRRKIETTNNGADWRSSVMPLLDDSQSP